MNFYNHKALTGIVNTYNIKEAYVFGETNYIRETENIYQFPIYMITFIDKDA